MQSNPIVGRGARSSATDGILDPSSENLVAISRLVLSAGGLAAIYLDPSQPSQEVGYLFVTGYVVLATALLASVTRPPRGVWAIVVHLTEVALVCLIIFYTEGPSSPFFIYFTFVLLVSALRWQRRGALLTGAALTTVLLGLSAAALTSHSNQADIDRLLLRNIYLLVASVLIALFGDELGRSRQHQLRLRLARELHDGILQSLTAVRLRLRNAATTGGEQRGEGLLDIEQLLAGEQRHIRNFVEQHRNGNRIEQATLQSSSQLSNLESFIDHLKRLWSTRIKLEVEGNNMIPTTLARELQPILAESVANAVVHGNAHMITISVNSTQDLLSLTVKDDGHGLKNDEGIFTHQQLAAKKIEPRALRTRIESIGGSLKLVTSIHGVELQIELPISSGNKALS